MFERVLVALAKGTGDADAAALASRLADDEADVVQVHIEHGSVAHGLRDEAVARGADLIVLGSSGRGLIGRTFAGDDVTSTLRCAPCAVAVAPRGYAAADKAIEHIGVGYDGSEQAQLAIDAARSLAERSGARLHALGIATPPQGLTTPIGVSAVAELEAKRDQIEDCIAELGPEITDRAVVDGVAHQELSELSERVDLLVIGTSRRHGRVSRALLGSTSEAVSREAACALLVVKAPEPGYTERLRSGR
jgi:nucleotide-binding universal stress UspA family protein